MRRAALWLFLAAAPPALGCGALGSEADWPPLAKKWFDRAKASFHQVDIEDAQVSIDNALRLEPNRPEVRLLAAQVALARLEYDAALKSLDGIDSREAQSLRGRAYWYSGQIERAADTLEQLLAHPEVRDPWAQEVAKLARRGGGRQPFAMSGALLAVSEMPAAGGSALIVPLELNGEPALGLIATGTAEVIVDASQGREPSWVSLRFDGRVEVKDVPALTKDLSGLSRGLNAPIRLLLGVNLLRHLRPTIDYRGSQFVVRTYEPPPPPSSTAVRLSYIRGGGMVLRGGVGRSTGDEMLSLLVDTSMQFPVALDDAGWRKAGVQLGALRAIPNGGGLKQGILPRLVVGAYDVPQVPGVHGAPLAEFERGLDVDLDGMVGAGLLAAFRVTLVDGGRTMWIEDMPALQTAPAPELPEVPEVPEPSAPAKPSGDAS